MVRKANIRRANLDGTNIEVVWTGVDRTSPYGIALDVAAGKMYWADTDSGSDSPGQSGRHECGSRGEYRDVGGQLKCLGLALDVPAGKLYWTDNADQDHLSGQSGWLDDCQSRAGDSGLRGLAIVHPGPDISVTHRTGLVTSEDGGSDVFRVTLTTQPTANVTIALSSSDTTEGTLSTSSLTFTPANWNITQTVTVTGVNDTLLDGDIAYTIILAAAVSSDPSYHGLNPADVSVVNRDNDVLPTKFYVVNDATQNQTYEYNASGGLVESYSLNSGNTAPRGAASTIAGDKTWVVDANRNVYVYNTSGGLLGSWTAGTLATNATVEGIATNGTDVWIVDAKSDKVFKYAGAATRLSGSQNAASSFSLNSGNTSPKDIVTDGASLWVVNDSTHRQGVQVHPRRHAAREAGPSTPPTPARPASRSIRPTSATSGSSTAAPTRSTSTTPPPAAPPAAKRPGDLRPGRRQHQPARHRRSAGPGNDRAGQRSGRCRLTAARVGRGDGAVARPGAQRLHEPVIARLASAERCETRPANGPNGVQHQLTVRPTSQSSSGDGGLVTTDHAASLAGHLTRLTDEILAEWDAGDCFGSALPS